MKQYVSLLVVSFLLVFVSYTLCGEITEPLKERMQEIVEGEMIPVNVVMEEQANFLDIKDRIEGKSFSERREIVIDYMKSIRDRSQSGILNYLSAMEKKKDVSRVRSLWIANVVCFNAKKAIIEEVATFPGVKSIDWDEERQLVFRPELSIQSLPVGREIVWNITKVSAPDVWALGYTGENIVVSLIDTGVRYTHVDLSDHIWTNPGETPNNNIDDDGNGYIDDYYGYDFHNNDSDPMDDYGHGTHCAGTVAGDGTAGSQTGVAPDARIMSLKVLSSSGSGQESSCWEAMQYSIDNGADVISMSLGWSHAWSPDRQTWRNTCNTVLASTIIMSVAAGNEDNYYGAPDNVRTPGDVPPPWLHPDQTLTGGLSAVVTIGATDINDNIASFSSRGPVSWENISPWYDYDYNPEMGLIDPDISAPGVDIKSLSYSSDYGYVSGWNGTSMATPHVAGAMALMFSKNIDLTQAVIDSVLEMTSLDLGANGKDTDFGAGRLDCYDAINATPDPGAHCVYSNHTIDDGTGGNGDGYISPFEDIDMSVILQNVGVEPSKDVVANLRLEMANSYITLVDTVSNFGDIQPDSSKQGTPPYSFSVAGGCPNGDTIYFEVQIMDSAGNDWLQTFTEVVWSPHLTYEGFVIDDAGQWRPNGILNAGEIVDGIVSLRNSNDYAHATGLSATMHISDTYVTVTDSVVSFPDITPGSTEDNGADPFVLEASESLPFEHEVDVELYVSGDNLVDTLYFSFIAGEKTGEDPTGPDDYAYWAYDMTDIWYTECPTYNWIEIDPNYGGDGTELVLGANQTEQLEIPFSFKYYGDDYDTISVCSNGWLALGVTEDSSFRYYPIPDPNGPPLCVAPFWGDLDPTQEGGVYYKYDSSIHGYIVEWSRIYHKQPGDEETFQVILSDPAYNPTVTGDGEIFCQYLIVKNPSTSCTGIEDESETIGLQYRMGDYYNPGSAVITDDFVLKFTTDPPEYVGIAEDEVVELYPKVFGLSQNVPNPFYSRTRIRYQVPVGYSGYVSLKVYDVSGKLVRTLVEGESGPGWYSVNWDGRDSKGSRVSSGIYFTRFSSGVYSETGKMLILR